MPAGGTLTRRCRRRPARRVDLEIADSGPGLPEEAAAAGLRAVLHDQAGRHGSGPGHRLRGSPKPTAAGRPAANRPAGAPSSRLPFPLPPRRPRHGLAKSRRRYGCPSGLPSSAAGRTGGQATRGTRSAACWWSTTTARPASPWPTCSARRATRWPAAPARPRPCRCSHGEAFDCIVTDLKMPGMNGLEFIVQLDQRRYAAQVVMVTAHATVSIGRRGHAARGLRLHRKTFRRRRARAAGRAGDPPRPAGARPGRRMLRRAVRPTAGDDRLQARPCRPCGRRSPSRPHAGNRADHRRERHRQGAGGPGHPRRQPPPPAARWSASTARCSPPT